MKHSATIIPLLASLGVLSLLASCGKDDDYHNQPWLSYLADELRNPPAPETPSGGSSDSGSSGGSSSGGGQVGSVESLSFTVSGQTFKVIKVNAGTFTMGATSEQGDDSYYDESPAHSVTLSPYYIGETEVTQGLWKAVMGSNPSYFSKGDNYPVESVSHGDCIEFCQKLSQKTGRTFTLPTEAQWEYAARGGHKRPGQTKYAGSNTPSAVAWYGEDYRSGSTHPVKGKQPNALGLYDMSGNVWEWCLDWYGDYSSASQTDPSGPASGRDRVLRGGSWVNYARDCRVSNRSDCVPSYRGHGLRLVLLP